ncbi:MAG TPA: zinc-binding alcohol dehydrogenase family protein [Cellulomonas sp.]
MTDDLTDVMDAVGYDRNLPIDDPRSLLDIRVPRPELRPHDLLVEVRAVSVNPVDVKQRASAQPGAGPRVLGFDAAGVVVEVGPEVTLFRPGDEVFYAGQIDRPGTDSALHAVDERIVGRKPTSLDFADAAALPLTSLTAWEGLFDKLGLTDASTGTLLVVGGAGGVGSMVIQLARAIAPRVRVVATASRGESESWVRGLGAHDVVDHHGDLVGQTKAIEPAGIRWIFSTHSHGQLEAFVDLLRPFGQVVAIDDPSELDVVPLKSKALSWHWEFMFARSLHQAPDMVEQHRILGRVADLVDEGRVRTTRTTTLNPIDAEQLREAHRLVETGGTIGKVVVAV